MNKIPEAFGHMLAAWNERDPGLIGDHVSKCLAENVVFADPSNFVKGREAFTEMVKKFRMAYPDSICYRTSGIDSHNSRCRYSWKILSGENLIVAGYDFVRLNEAGLVESIDGFFGELPAIES